jgi:hypothetical protein
MMELDYYLDMSGESMDYSPTFGDGRYLLPNLSSKGLTSAEQRPSGKPPEASANKVFVSQSSLVPKLNMQPGSVISKIEDILQQMVDCIIDEKKELVLHLRARVRSGNEVLDAANGAIKSSAMMEARAIRFPGRTAQEAWKFST